jgi:hypothetical protein
MTESQRPFRIVDRKPSAWIRAKIKFITERSYRIALSCRKSSLSKIGKEAVFRVVNKELEGKHAASVDSAIRAKPDYKNKSPRGSIFERNFFLLLFRRIPNSKDFVIDELELPAVWKALRRKRDIGIGNSYQLFSFFDPKPSVGWREPGIDLSIVSFDQTDSSGFSALGWDEGSFGLVLWIEDDDVRLRELDGAVDQTILSSSGVAIELFRIHPAKMLALPAFRIVGKKDGRGIGPTPDLSIRRCRQGTDKRLCFTSRLSKIIPTFCFWIEPKEMSVVIAPEVNPILMIDCKTPSSHFRRKRAVELPHLTRVRIDSKEKKGSLILPEGEVNRIPPSCLAWPHMDS